MPLNSLNSNQIRRLSLKNKHIANDAAIDENKLNINWNNHVGHIHANETYMVVELEGIQSYVLQNLNIKESDYISVYINSSKQFPVEHFSKEVTNGRVSSIIFGGVIKPGDIIYIEYIIYNTSV